MLFSGWRCDLYRGCVSPGVRANRKIQESWPQLARRVSLSGGVPLVGPQEALRGPSAYTLRVCTWGASSPWQEAYFKPMAGGEVRIVGFHINKQANKTNWEQGAVFKGNLPATCDLESTLPEEHLASLFERAVLWGYLGQMVPFLPMQWGATFLDI